MSLEVRTAVARATRGVIPQWPLSSFIAVNPLGSKEPLHFAAAAATRTRVEFLTDYAASRISDADLVGAALQNVPELSGVASVTIGDRTFSAAELAVAELVLVDQPWVPAPSPAPSDFVDEIVAKWVAAYLDPHPIWTMPDRDRGFWTAWSAMARHDPQLPGASRRRLRNLPSSAGHALSDALAKLGVDSSASEQVLRAESDHLPGWVAHIKWRADHVGDIDLTSYLAVRLTLRWAVGHDVTTLANRSASEGVAASPRQRAALLLAQLHRGEIAGETLALVTRILSFHPLYVHPFTWQSAYEQNYRIALLARIGRSEQACLSPSASRERPHVQVVMCIDPRSEGVRRHLESVATIETLGFAGFFGVPIRFASYRARGSIDSLPALIAARHSVTEAPRDLRKARRRVAALRVRDALAEGVHASEISPAAPFALAETLGWFYGAASLVRTLWPGLADAASRLLSRTAPAISTSVTIADAFSADERAAFAATAMRMMGLTGTAPLVVFAGHGSESTNNLYQSALDCGACGGNPGSANARAAAAIFNDPEVRNRLAERGLSISDDTFFVAAEHNTVSDHIEILDPHLIPESHRASVAELQTGQAKAADSLVAERARLLPGAASHSVSRLRRRAHDWAEVYPELGLVGNAAMIIGPRDLTRGTDLQRRVFLHSYRPEVDPDGVALETIMTAPLVVAQWINHQYYFSTVDKARWGAGTKTIHNAIGTLGVISGQAGDLKMGLPLQSVAVGARDLHEPMRLAVIIQAPLERIGAIVSRNQVLRHLFDNEWITLTARHDDHSPWHRYGTYGFTPEPGFDDTKQGE